MLSTSSLYGGRTVLIVDDDEDLVAMLETALRRKGQETITAYDARTAFRLFRQRQPDLILLDIMLGASNGLQLLTAIREVSAVSIIMLTALDDNDAKVRGLKMGADDYITKPFSIKELMARIEVQFRRASRAKTLSPSLPSVIEAGSLIVDESKHMVTQRGKRIDLTPKESDFLHCLIRRAGNIVPYRTLLQEVWNDSSPGGTRDIIRVTVHRLREKLEDDPRKPVLLRISSAVGVMLALDEPNI